MACSRGRRSCIVHTPDKARLIERLPEGNRRAALDVLSEIRPQNASILNRVRAWKQLSIDLAQRIAARAKSTIDRPDANCAPAKASEPEYIASKSVPIVRQTARASSVEIPKRRSSFLTAGAQITIIASQVSLRVHPSLSVRKRACCAKSKQRSHRWQNVRERSGQQQPSAELRGSRKNAL